jgi:hypothetical protein
MCDWYEGVWDAEQFDIAAVSFAPKKPTGKKKR